MGPYTRTYWPSIEIADFSDDRNKEHPILFNIKIINPTGGSREYWFGSWDEVLAYLNNWHNETSQTKDK